MTASRPRFLPIDPKIGELDLEQEKLQLRKQWKWPKDFCDCVCQEYLRFLTLVRRCPRSPIVPSRIIDRFWHAHILNTRKYDEDCKRALGEFLHHDPDHVPDPFLEGAISDEEIRKDRA